MYKIEQQQQQSQTAYVHSWHVQFIWPSKHFACKAIFEVVLHLPPPASHKIVVLFVSRSQYHTIYLVNLKYIKIPIYISAPEESKIKILD